MVESKSVKVDNWGVFFLQKLQNFFNKTDYCDLTLQFNDNSQLKVHRLVLSACTDYFNVLENQSDMSAGDDTLTMPNDLQADVVVPIVNFMYTGTLEFEVNMYGRLLKTAKDMNMTVLLKLLEAHKRTVDISSAVGRSKMQQQPIVLNKSVGQQQQQRVNTYARPTGTATVAGSVKRTYTPQRNVTVPVVTKIKFESGREPAQQTVAAVSTGNKNMPVSTTTTAAYMRKNLSGPLKMVAKYANTTSAAGQRGPSRFDCSETITSDQFESSFDNISYESRPLMTASSAKDESDEASGSFEQLRKSYTGL